MTPAALAVVRLTALMVAHPLWRGALGRVAALPAASLVACAVVALDLGPEQTAQMMAQLSSGFTLERSAVLWAAVSGLLVGLVAGIPAMGLVGGSGWVARRLSLAPSSVVTWTRLHLLLAGWLLASAGGWVSVVEALRTLARTPGPASAGLEDMERLGVLAGVSLDLAVGMTAPVLIVGVVMVAVAEWTGHTHPPTRPALMPSVRTLASAGILVAWTASWDLYRDEHSLRTAGLATGLPAGLSAGPAAHGAP